MEQITQTTHYWLFKPTQDNGKYHYVRTKTDGLDKFGWFIGYKNNLGLVSRIGGDLNNAMIENLENEFQLKIN